MSATVGPKSQENSELGGVVVAFNPDEGFEGRVVEMARQVGVLVVVDNTETEQRRASIADLCRRRGWGLESDGRNKGIAAALNLGMARLKERGCTWALLFDQDSTPAAGMGEKLLASWNAHPSAERLAVIGPTFVEASTGRRHRVLMEHPRCHWWFRKAEIAEADLPSVTMVITSGSLLRIDRWEACGRFDEGLFIDYVDTEFCLRCIAHGWLVGVSAAAHMHHQLGGRSIRRWLGIEVHPTNHPPVRHFYICRNRIIIWRRHAVRFPHWAWFDLATVFLWSFRVVSVEERKWAKVSAMIRGTWAGLRNHRGRAPG